MNKEVDLILTKLKIVSEEKENGAYICDREHSKLLLSYIEQLEADYKEANDSITWWTNRYNALNKEYKLLKDRNEINIDRNIEAYRIVEQLESNRDKVIEYLESHFTFNNKTGECYQTHTFDKDNVKKLYDILKGDSDYE